MQRRGPARVEVGFDLLAQPGRRRRAQVEVGERRAQVEPGTADDDGPPALAERRVDRLVRALREVPGGEGGVRRQKRDEQMLEFRTVRRARDAGKRLEAAIDLQ